jgi:hypothetical protein
MLVAYKIERFVDVRSMPRSWPSRQFNSEVIAKSPCNRRVLYRDMKDPGGFRHGIRNSINTAREKASFRGFADHMRTSDFKAAMGRQTPIAAGTRP